MSNQDLGPVRKRLLELRDELQALDNSGSEAAGIVELDQARVGRLSRMDALQLQAMSQASGRRRQQTRLAIDAALKRIETGEFGICPECDEPVDPRRLQFDPTAKLCISCAEKGER